MRTLVAVYGTLKKGHRNHSIITHVGGEFFKKIHIKNVAMFGVSPTYSFPVAVKSPGDIIEAEAYYIPVKELHRLDDFEYYDRDNVRDSLFVRDAVYTSDVPGGHVWIYLFNQQLPERKEKISNWQST
jgi:gamma-glutamylcyclotransferase (GGCT)/AIG2-like uncharacterized protein YtfP